MAAGNHTYTPSGIAYNSETVGVGPRTSLVGVDNPLPVRDYTGDGFSIAKGDAPGYSVVHKFGHNYAVGTTMVPIAIGGIYRTPQVSGATTVRIKAGDANDTAAGSGAREVTMQGLDETGALQTAVLASAGASASSSTTVTFIRLFRAWISASGTYATQSAGSQAADVVIENTAGTEDWLTITANSFPAGQSGVGVYTIPLGYTGYVMEVDAFVDSNKSADLILFKRENILETAAPYSAMRELVRYVGVSGPVNKLHTSPIRLPELTDFGFMGVMASGTSEISVHYEIRLVADA